MLKKRIVVIDCDDRSRLLIASMLRVSAGYNLISAYDNSYDAVRHAAKDKPEIIVTDVMFPDISPRAHIQRLAERNHLVEILVLTDSHDENLVVECISYGASGFLLKDKLLENLIKSLDAISRGGSPLDFIAARKLISHLQLANESPLTRQESKVLKLITEGKTSSRIAEELEISAETSKTHIKNIYKKLDVNSKTDAVRKAYREKLVPITL